MAWVDPRSRPILVAISVASAYRWLPGCWMLSHPPCLRNAEQERERERGSQPPGHRESWVQSAAGSGGWPNMNPRPPCIHSTHSCFFHVKQGKHRAAPQRTREVCCSRVSTAPLCLCSDVVVFFSTRREGYRTGDRRQEKKNDGTRKGLGVLPRPTCLFSV